MNNEQEREIGMFWNAIRNTVRYEDLVTAAILTNEVKNRTANMKKETPDTIYRILIDVVTEMHIGNPFTDAEQFYYIYKISQSFKKIDWEGMIEKMLRLFRNAILPSVIIDLYKERFATKPDSVLIAEAEKFVPNLQNMVDENTNAKFVLTTRNMSYAKALEQVFADYDNVEVLLTDIYEYEFVNKRFDLIFSCPNFGSRTLSENKTFMCRELDMIALENLSLHLSDGGRLVIILPGRITFSSGRIGDLRQFIQQNYTIKEIAELPEASLESTGVKVYLLDIENTRPADDDIIVRRYSAGKRKTRKSAVTSLEIVDDTFVMLEELEDQGDWNIDRIFAQQDEEYLKFQKSGIRKELLGNVAQVFRGKAVSRKDPAGNIGVINISNIGDYEIDYDGLDHLQEEERRLTNYLLQEGDVLLPARGTAIRTVVFHKQAYPCIASANVIVIRPESDMLNSVYLKIFIDSPIGKSLIGGLQQGITVMNISYNDLKLLEVPVPSIDEQNRIAAEYEEGYRNYINTVNEAETCWNKTLNKLQNF